VAGALDKDWLRGANPVLLTDDYAPAANLTAPEFLERGLRRGRAALLEAVAGRGSLNPRGARAGAAPEPRSRQPSFP